MRAPRVDHGQADGARAATGRGLCLRRIGDRGETPSLLTAHPLVFRHPNAAKTHHPERAKTHDPACQNSRKQVMLEDIAQCAALGADGVVTGCLKADGSVDMDTTARLLAAARRPGLDFTFHRAFDMARDFRWVLGFSPTPRRLGPRKHPKSTSAPLPTPIMPLPPHQPQPHQQIDTDSAALDQLIALGVPRVLTSGGRPSAVQVLRRPVPIWHQIFHICKLACARAHMTQTPQIHAPSSSYTCKLQPTHSTPTPQTHEMKTRAGTRCAAWCIRPPAASRSSQAAACAPAAPPIWWRPRACARSTAAPGGVQRGMGGCGGFF
jgi:hypothetical protein